MIPDKFSRLINVTAASETVSIGLEGRERALLDAIAMGTVLRASELRSLIPGPFHLSDEMPTVRVPAGYTKNGREAIQPLPSSLMKDLRPWLEEKATGQPVFAYLTDKTAKMLRADLQSAGIPIATDKEVVDFHALRHTYETMVVSGGASVKTAQELLRHSDPTLTISRYAHTRPHDIQGAVDHLEFLKSHNTIGSKETNEFEISGHVLAHDLSTEGVASCRFASESGEDTDSGRTPATPDSVGSCRPESASVGDAACRTRTCNLGIMSPLLCH